MSTTDPFVQRGEAFWAVGLLFRRSGFVVTVGLWTGQLLTQRTKPRPAGHETID